MALNLRDVSGSKEAPFREAVWCAVGDSLAFALPQNALLQELYPNRNTHDAALTHLLTHRFAVGSEIPGGSTPIDAGRLKTISGGDSMALREPNEKHGRNRPASATLFLCLNTHNEGCRTSTASRSTTPPVCGYTPA